MKKTRWFGAVKYKPVRIGLYEFYDSLWGKNEADARLIAAAPDLLAALQGLLSAVQRSVCEGSGPAQEAAHAAINRALGRAA